MWDTTNKWALLPTADLLPPCKESSSTAPGRLDHRVPACSLGSQLPFQPTLAEGEGPEICLPSLYLSMFLSGASGAGVGLVLASERICGMRKGADLTTELCKRLLLNGGFDVSCAWWRLSGSGCIRHKSTLCFWSPCLAGVPPPPTRVASLIL